MYFFGYHLKNNKEDRMPYAGDMLKTSFFFCFFFIFNVCDKMLSIAFKIKPLELLDRNAHPSLGQGRW